MTITTYDGFLKRVGDGFFRKLPLGSARSISAARLITANPNDSSHFPMRIGMKYTVPAMETGVSAYIPLRVLLTGASVPVMCVKLIDMGSIDISGASGTFTDGSAMPTLTELGASANTASPVLAEATVALNATPGSISVTYVDQDGNAAEASPASALGASAAVGTIGVVPLNGSDWGARDITAATRSAGTTPTGTIKFWGTLPIALFSPVTANAWDPEDFITQSTNLIRLAAGDVLGFFTFGSATNEWIGDMHFVGDT